MDRMVYVCGILLYLPHKRALSCPEVSDLWLYHFMRLGFNNGTSQDPPLSRDTGIQSFHIVTSGGMDYVQ